MADTVQKLLDTLEPKLLGYQDALVPAGSSDTNEARKVLALNEAQHALWRLLVSLGKRFGSYWFTKSASLSAATGTPDIDLPLDFHDLLMLSAQSTLQKVQFEPSAFSTAVFLSGRRSDQGDADATEERIYYVVGRGNPSRLHLSRSLVATLDCTYTYTLPDFVDKDSDIDDLLVSYRGPITSYAAEGLMAGVDETARAATWRARWLEDKATIIEAASNAQNPPDTVGTRDYEGA